MSQSKPNESAFNRRVREKQESRDAQVNAENARFAIPGAVVDFGGAKRLW